MKGLVYALALLGAAGNAWAQDRSATVGDLARRLTTIAAVTGLEQRMVDTLLALLPGARRDRAGNAVLALGTGATRRLVACPIDEPGYVVGNIREDGYLTLRRSPGRPSPARDGQLEGQRVSIWTSDGVVPGVVAVKSIHLTRGRDLMAAAPFTVDSALVDVGAGTTAEATSLGIALLAPVTLEKRPHRYGGDLLAAPVAGRRAACAALLAAGRRALERRTRRPVVVAFVVEQELSGRGLGTLAHGLGPFEETVIVDGSGADPSEPAGQWPALGRVTSKPLAVRYPGTPVETVSTGDAARLADELARWIEGEP